MDHNWTPMVGQYSMPIDVDNRKVIWNHKGRGKTIPDKFYHKIGKKGCGQ
jgi:hypothetical protein